MSKPRTGIPADHSAAPPFSSARTGTRTASDFSPPQSGGLRTVANEEAWGEQKASDRYGGGTRHPNMRTGDETAEPQKAGDVNNLWASGHPNDCSKDWRVGFPDQSAESKPNFDPRNKSGEAKKW